ncbi:MAG: hypothetical protein LBV54_01075 [Puniceicoccales bacterium]|jgi:hypothetical protein|nr:hypothetical protein [Puniceicoccales bacterium]
MPFKSYQITPDSASGGFLLEAPQPLVFSGKHGLIARHIRRLQPDSEGSAWTLHEDDIADLLIPPPTTTRWLVFAQQDGDSSSELRLSRLLRIRGFSDAQTELLFTFSPLAVHTIDGDPARLLAHEPTHGREWNEELALNGGLSNLDGPWTWCDRALNIGATVMKPSLSVS